MAKQINFSMTATFCIFTQGKTNQTFLHDSNILHFYTKQKSKQILEIISNILFTCKLTQFKKNVKNQSLHVNKRI